MIEERYEQALAWVLAPFALASFYMFSRFTVDDAFITWRYGKNLVTAGVWAYNPTTFDLTQAYTNPLMAALSIIPAALGVDVVLFFKLLAALSLGLLLTYLWRVTTRHGLMMALCLAFLALPATMIHAFSGLETFVFAAAMGMLLISLLRADMQLANVLALLLLLVRPEAWLLVGLVPTYHAYHGGVVDGRFSLASALRNLRPALASLALLGGTFTLYAALHYRHFGHVLPNTYYIKSGSVLDATRAAYFLLFVAPAAALLLVRRRALLAFALLLFLPMAYSYASSSLEMNYAARFAYHIFGPVYLLLAYLAATEPRRPGVLARRYLIVGLPAGYLLVFALLSAGPQGLVSLVNYYPRMLEAHAALGKQIHALRGEGTIKSFALSDAGVVAFHSGALAFDNFGLGSALVAHHGPTRETIDLYAPDMVVLRANAEGVVLNSSKKQQMFDWTTAAGYQPRGDVYLRSDYRLRLFTAKPVPQLEAICARSKAMNDVTESDYFAQHSRVPPWQFWHE